MAKDFQFDNRLVRTTCLLRYGNPGEHRDLPKGSYAIAIAATNTPEDSPIEYWLTAVGTWPERVQNWAESVGCAAYAGDIEDALHVK